MWRIYEYFIRNYPFIFDRWNKWELVEKDSIRKRESVSPVIGTVDTTTVKVDVYKRVNHYTGKVKYKFIEK